MLWIIGMVFVLIMMLVCFGIGREIARGVRAHRWYKAHGVKIGSEEFFGWCMDNGEDPGRYF